MDALPGWRPDPSHLHEFRFFAMGGKPTRLVSDNSFQSVTVSNEIPDVAARIPEVAAEIPSVVAEIPEVVAEIPSVTAGIPDDAAGVPDVAEDVQANTSAARSLPEKSHSATLDEGAARDPPTEPDAPTG